jgi:UDP-glucose 4-epimerase
LQQNASNFTHNLGTGRGHSVLEVVQAFVAATGRPVPYRIVDRRPGDVAQCFADPSRARALLQWEPRHTLAQMCADAWRWQQRNPAGYAREGTPMGTMAQPPALARGAR